MRRTSDRHPQSIAFSKTSRSLWVRVLITAVKICRLRPVAATLATAPVAVIIFPPRPPGNRRRWAGAAGGRSPEIFVLSQRPQKRRPPYLPIIAKLRPYLERRNRTLIER